MAVDGEKIEANKNENDKYDYDDNNSDCIHCLFNEYFISND